MRKRLQNIEPTINDVAKDANVSVASVSRVLNDPKSVAPQTFKKVMKSIKKLGYSKNTIASSLKSQKSNFIGILVADIFNPFFVEIIKAAEKIIYDNGYTPIICDAEEDSQKETNYLMHMLYRRIEGLIIIPALENTKIPEIIKDLKIPVVFIDRYFSKQYDSVRVNNIYGMNLLLGHFLDKQLKKIALVSGPRDTLPGRERYDAFISIAEEKNIGIEQEYLKISDFTIEGGCEAVKELCDLEDPPEGIVICNNLMGVGALKALNEIGWKHTVDIEIIVFDDYPFFSLVDPPITVVKQPAYDMGNQAANRLMERISSSDERKFSPFDMMFKPELIVRA